MTKKKREASLKNVYALGLVSFFTDVSSEMCFSILPAFILSLPGGSRSVLGFIEGLAEALSYSMRAVSGVFSDMFRRRKILVLIGYALSNVVKPLFSVVSSALDVLIIRVADRVGKGIRTSPRDALLSESVSEKHRGTAFGLHRTLDQTGAILGPALASALMIAFAFTPRDIFWLSFIPGTAALIVILFFVKEKISKFRKEFKLLEGVRTVLKGRFLLLLVVVGIFYHNKPYTTSLCSDQCYPRSHSYTRWCSVRSHRQREDSSSWLWRVLHICCFPANPVKNHYNRVHNSSTIWCLRRSCRNRSKSFNPSICRKWIERNCIRALLPCCRLRFFWL